MTASGFQKHDHFACIAKSLAAVDTCCGSKGLRLTPVRRRVLEILLAQHRAMGAYDILEILSAEGLGSQPPVVYRALEFLVNNGFAHRIEGLNAFVACSLPGQSHAPAFLICRSCEAVSEATSDPTRGTLGAAASTAGFVIENTVVEARGLCPRCAAEAQT
jgi:Fur family zinc uptake transcriptional regulator